MSASRRPLRVVLALESSGPGGAENMVLQLASALRERGHEVAVATMREGWMTQRARAAELPVWLEPQKQGLDLGWIWRFARRLRRERIDVLHTHEFAMNVFGGLASRLARVASLSTIHGKHWIADRQRRAAAYRILRRLGVPIVCVSEDLATFLVEGLGVLREQLVLVHNGIVLPAPGAAPEQSAARRALDIPPDGALLVAVGNLYPVKDHATLIRALPKLPGVRVAIAGRGEEEENLRRLSVELDVSDRVHLLGLRDDVDRVLASADLFVQPSLSEGLPLAILEAMAFGLPVLASRVGGMAEAVADGETGLLVEPGDAEGLAEGARRLLADPQGMKAMGAAGRRRVEAEFSVRTMADAYESAYLSLLPGWDE